MKFTSKVTLPLWLASDLSGTLLEKDSMQWQKENHHLASGNGKAVCYSLRRTFIFFFFSSCYVGMCCPKVAPQDGFTLQVISRQAGVIYHRRKVKEVLEPQILGRRENIPRKHQLLFAL